MTPFKITLFAIIAILAGVAVWEHQAIVKARADTVSLQQQLDQFAPVLAENERLSNLVAQAGNTTPEQVHELVKLRAEVSNLRVASAQADAAKARLQKSESEAAALRAQVSEIAKTQEENRQLQAQAAQSQVVAAQNTCVNTLRLLDAAKQQWALENKKTSADTPTMDDIRPYVGKGPNGAIPVCPAGGSYTLGTVGEPPKCSVPGHVLP